MLVASDDELYRVDEVWLGPDQFPRLPWRATYRAYGIFAVFAVAIQVLERQLGIGLGFWSVTYGLAAAIVATRAVSGYLDYDRPVAAMAREFALELSGPRAQTATTSVLWRAGRMPLRRRRRSKALARVYQRDATVDRDEALPSWFSQFRPSRRREHSPRGGHDTRTSAVIEHRDKADDEDDVDAWGSSR